MVSRMRIGTHMQVLAWAYLRDRTVVSTFGQETGGIYFTEETLPNGDTVLVEQKGD